MKKILFFCLIGLLAFSCGNNVSTTPSPEITLDDLFFGTDSTFEVVTWNIQNFPKAGITTANYVVQVIMAIDADVFALQEIESSSYFDYVVSQLNEKDTLSTWDGYQANSADYNINLAFVYKTNVVQMEAVYELFDTMYVWYRPFPRRPLVMEMYYNSELLYIINNHFKAFGDGFINLEDEWDEETRRLEASTLLEEYIDQNLQTDNVILLGDLNDDITDSQQNNVFLPFIEKPDKYKFTDMYIAGGSSSNWSWQGWNSSYPPSHLDHILITNELFDEYENSTVQTILVDHYLDGGWHEYKESISDHRPVGMKFAFE